MIIIPVGEETRRFSNTNCHRWPADRRIGWVDLVEPTILPGRMAGKWAIEKNLECRSLELPVSLNSALLMMKDVIIQSIFNDPAVLLKS